MKLTHHLNVMLLCVNEAWSGIRPCYVYSQVRRNFPEFGKCGGNRWNIKKITCFSVKNERKTDNTAPCRELCEYTIQCWGMLHSPQIQPLNDHKKNTLGIPNFYLFSK